MAFLILGFLNIELYHIYPLVTLRPCTHIPISFIMIYMQSNKTFITVHSLSITYLAKICLVGLFPKTVRISYKYDYIIKNTKTKSGHLRYMS